jgi:ABC-type bacteriocin/lantibiotic exporter with double-glycine peptidase domain
MNIASKEMFPHIQQQFNWDCGIISCQMCLRWCGMYESFDQLTQRCPTKSTWSIDLAYLLHEIGMKVFVLISIRVFLEYQCTIVS